MNTKSIRPSLEANKPVPGPEQKPYITMRKKIPLLLLGLFSLFQLLICQSIQNDVISSSGGSFVSGNMQLNFSIGESVTETFQNTYGDILTQGFHQPMLTATGIAETNLFPDVTIFPNPAVESVYIHIPVHYGLMKVHIYNVSGKLLEVNHYNQGLNELNVTNLPTGVYFLKLTSENQNQKTFKLIKIN